MVKEAIELVTARAALRKAEKDLGDPATFIHLRNGIVSLLGMISGDSRQIEKDLARKLMLTYKNKVRSEVKDILASFDSYEADSLNHWNKVMEVFIDAGVDDPEFNVCREQLIAKRSNLSMYSLKPGDLDAVEKELREVLNSLSAHRSRLSNLKWGIRK
jgi:DNA primase catalytic subunit